MYLVMAYFTIFQPVIRCHLICDFVRSAGLPEKRSQGIRGKQGSTSGQPDGPGGSHELDSDGFE